MKSHLKYRYWKILIRILVSSRIRAHLKTQLNKCNYILYIYIANSQKVLEKKK